MKDTRRNRMWALAGVFALALSAGVAVNRTAARRQTRMTVADEDLKDAVAAPPATVGLAGKPVPTSWFKTPAQQHAEMDSALLGPRRSLARRVALQ